MRRAILGTAGHIDHGKTALVQALTGVDTDRLPEEKARGITIDLGFAELTNDAGVRLGVVDVPGHEDFIRTMVAGASGMDVVLLTVAADEGMMPQTREHLDIVTLLAVPHMVVALTKVDLVDPEWLALVEEDVRDVLAATRYAGAVVVPTSSRTGEGIEALRAAVMSAAAQARARVEEDVARLPVDRSFTVQGMGTVVTGTLWSGTLSVGNRVRVLPGDKEARIRSIQVHGKDADTARAGERTAVALSGVDRGGVGRGEVLVAGAAWEPTWMITARASVLPTASKPLEQGVRVRVLTGTTEVLARCAVLEEGGEVHPGQDGWIQLRLEEPAVARMGDRLVIRSYAPLLTVGGGVVAEPTPPKRRKLDDGQRAALDAVVSSQPEERVDAVLRLADWAGVRADGLAQRTGLTPSAVARCLDPEMPGSPLVVRGVVFALAIVERAGSLIQEAMARGHQEDTLRPSVPLERLRASLPVWASSVLADGVLAHLAQEGSIELAQGGARAPGFVPTATADQEAACAALEALYREAGLSAPFVDDLPDALRQRKDLGQLLRYLEGKDTLRTIDEGLLVPAESLDRAAAAVAGALSGRVDLGPADFREVLPVSRRHLMPLLAYLDGQGVTVRRGGVRDVPGDL